MLIAASIVVLSAGSAAAADVMAGYYGNTIVITGPSLKVHVHYAADHTLEVAGTRSGKAFSTKGTWKIDDKGQICRSYETPPPGVPNPFCGPAASHKVGDKWSMSGAGGETTQQTLVAGIN
jgi:hypothetical protein